MTRSSSAPTATATACCTKVGIKRGPWTAEEDEVLARFVRKEGEGRWRTLPKRAGLLRCGKSCRLRWMNYLRPSVKRGHISPDEEDLILRLHRLLGNRWSLIAGRIPGRTDNEIKNYWNTHLSKKLISQGIDPRTHRPFKPNSIAKPSSSSSSFKPSDPTLALIPNPFNKKLTKQPPSESHDHHHHNQADDDHLSNNNNDDVQVTTTNDATLLHHHPSFDNDFMPSSHHHHHQLGTNEQADDHLNYCCSDEVFSSFLNSLINDDDDVAFAAAVTNSQLPVVSAADDHPFLSVNTNTVWESAIVTSSSFNKINDDDPVG